MHQADWRHSVQQRSKTNINGIRRILQHAGNLQPWQRPVQTAVQPHDEEEPDNHGRRNYFTPNRFYCVETLCAPCGVVLAWTKFAKAESPINILTWLENIYPDSDMRPSYIAIDKACQVMQKAINNGSWEQWRLTTRFIVDSYHYINHKAEDVLCRTWCNPAPSDGSAPNLVGQHVDEKGNVHQFREFNTEACEQLNSWLGGFESILKRMTVHNFNWFLHAMLFYHCNFMLTKKAESRKKKHRKTNKTTSGGDSNENVSDSESSNDENIHSDMDCN